MIASRLQLLPERSTGSTGAAIGTTFGVLAVLGLAAVLIWTFIRVRGVPSWCRRGGHRTARPSMCGMGKRTTIVRYSVTVVPDVYHASEAQAAGEDEEATLRRGYFSSAREVTVELGRTDGGAKQKDARMALRPEPAATSLAPRGPNWRDSSGSPRAAASSSSSRGADAAAVSAAAADDLFERASTGYDPHRPHVHLLPAEDAYRDPFLSPRDGPSSPALGVTRLHEFSARFGAVAVLEDIDEASLISRQGGHSSRDGDESPPPLPTKPSTPLPLPSHRPSQPSASETKSSYSSWTDISGPVHQPALNDGLRSPPGDRAAQGRSVSPLWWIENIQRSLPWRREPSVSPPPAPLTPRQEQAPVVFSTNTFYHPLTYVGSRASSSTYSVPGDLSSDQTHIHATQVASLSQVQSHPFLSIVPHPSRTPPSTSPSPDLAPSSISRTGRTVRLAPLSIPSAAPTGHLRELSAESTLMSASSSFREYAGAVQRALSAETFRSTGARSSRSQRSAAGEGSARGHRYFGLDDDGGGDVLDRERVTTRLLENDDFTTAESGSTRCPAPSEPASSAATHVRLAFASPPALDLAGATDQCTPSLPSPIARATPSTARAVHPWPSPRASTAPALLLPVPGPTPARPLPLARPAPAPARSSTLPPTSSIRRLPAVPS